MGIRASRINQMEMETDCSSPCPVFLAHIGSHHSHFTKGPRVISKCADISECQKSRYWALFLTRDLGERKKQGGSRSFPAATQREKEQILCQGRLCKQCFLAGAMELGKQRKGSLFSPTPAGAQSQSYDCLLWQEPPCLKGLGVPGTCEASVGFPYEAEKRTTHSLNLSPKEVSWETQPPKASGPFFSSFVCLFPFLPSPHHRMLASIFLPLMVLLVLILVFHPKRNYTATEYKQFQGFPLRNPTGKEGF